MGEESSPTERSQTAALKAKLLYPEVCSATQQLDLFLQNENAHKEVFKPHVLALRDVVQQVCIKLMFLHPVDYGRKAEELLWRKMYSDVVMVLMKMNRKRMDTFKDWEGPLRAHLVGGLKFYEHLFLFLQHHYELRLQSYIDWPHCDIHLIGCKKVGPASEEEVAWARMACHRCLLYLGDLFRYQNEFLALATKDLAERCYYRALSVAPHMGMPFNQLGALTGNKYYDVEATYFYQSCLDSEVPFKGAAWNLKCLYDHAGKRYSRMQRDQGKKLSPSQKQCWDNKRLLVSFLYLQSLLQPQKKFKATRLITLCQLVLEDFRLCLSYRPCSSNQSQTSAEGKPPRGYLFLPDLLIFHMVLLCLMAVHRLRKTNSKQHKQAVVFTLTIFSHLIQHVNTRIQAEFQQGKLTPEVVTPSNGSQETETGEEQQDIPAPCPGLHHEEEDEEKTSFLCSQDYSEASSKTSYSDIADEAGSDSLNPATMQESGATSIYKDAHLRGKLTACKLPFSRHFLKTTLSANLPTPLSQKHQGKHHLHLAPVFTYSILKAQSDLSPASSNTSDPKDNTGSFPEVELSTGSYLDQSHSTHQSCSKLQTIQKKLKILSAEGLLPTIKVIVGWLRTNHSFLTSYWQSPLSLWDHLSVLLNFLPSVGDLLDPSLGLSHQLQDLLQSYKGPNTPKFLHLPEDIALCQHFPLQASQDSVCFEQGIPALSPQDEAAVRICFLRSFGHFATQLPTPLLRFDSKLGVFVSTGLEGSENPSQQSSLSRELQG
ncbi:protein SMG5-like [Orycteropus afer afer]|uniref:Protein SMG5-like n=1 Tax=Orycteropus afer afer TaxID=1230840 RepID=A0AC54ZG17_ORYAF|nr:protein SMG5-like [Orycteropus afer afer]